jgi:hypothetical protein
MDIFSDILTKSRFEQQPITGNFKPRPDPKNNTTKGEKPVALAKESPRPVPGISEPHPDPKRRGKPKGRKAGGTFISDDGGTDDATYIVGMMKERFGRQYSRGKKAAKSHQRDLGQSAMYARQQSLLGYPPELEEMKEAHGAKETGRYAVNPEAKAEIKRHRRRANKVLDRVARTQAKPISTRRREKAMPKRGGTRTYSTGKQPSWELRRGQRGGRNRGTSETTPTSTTGRADRSPKESSDILWGHQRKHDSIDWKRGSDKYKNIDRETVNPNKMEKAEGTSGARGWKTMREFPYRMGSKQVKSDKHKNIDRATIRKPETVESMEKAERQEIHGRGLEGIPKGGLRPSKTYKNPYWKDQAKRQERRFRQVIEHKKYLKEQAAAKPPTRSQIRDKTKADVKAAGLDFAGMQKSKGNNIYAIATAAAEGDEDKKEKIVRALKREHHQKLLKAFGVIKAESNTGTELKPEDYKSKKTVDQVIAEGNRPSQYSHRPPARAKKDGRSGRTTMSGLPDEDYEDVGEVQRQRDERYLAGQPGGQKVGRRASTRGYKYGTADTGPRQRFMDVGRTGAPVKPVSTTTRTASEQDRRKRGRGTTGKVDPMTGGRSSGTRSGPSESASSTGLGVRETEEARKKRLAALSPEDRKKTDFQRLKEADTKRAEKTKEAGKETSRRQTARKKAKKTAESAKSRLDKINERLDAMKRTLSESQPVDKRPQLMSVEKLYKAFGVPISMPGGKRRVLPIAPNSEGGYFTKESGGRHSLHPVARRPKTVTEKSDGGEEYASGARGKTPAILGMEKAKKYVQRELPFSTEDEDHIAPTPDPHADTLPEPTQRGGPRPGSKRKGEIPKGGWKEAALLWPPQPKENGKGRKVKTRVSDSPGGYPT